MLPLIYSIAKSGSAQGVTLHACVKNTRKFGITEMKKNLFQHKSHLPTGVSLYLDTVVVLFETHENGFTEVSVSLPGMKDCFE